MAKKKEKSALGEAVSLVLIALAIGGVVILIRAAKNGELKLPKIGDVAKDIFNPGSSAASEPTRTYGNINDYGDYAYKTEYYSDGSLQIWINDIDAKYSSSGWTPVPKEDWGTVPKPFGGTWEAYDESLLTFYVG